MTLGFRNRKITRNQTYMHVIKLENLLKQAPVQGPNGETLYIKIPMENLSLDQLCL